jgi:hypothetical protein
MAHMRKNDICCSAQECVAILSCRDEISVYFRKKLFLSNYLARILFKYRLTNALWILIGF